MCILSQSRAGCDPQFWDTMFALWLFFGVCTVSCSLANEFPEILKTSSGYERMTIHRLPNTTRPLKYELHMVPYLEGDFKFAGYVVILVQIENATEEIMFHSKGLQITNIIGSLPWRYRLDEDNELLIISAQRRLPVNAKYEIRIEFKGYMDDEMAGLYRSYYRIGNETR